MLEDLKHTLVAHVPILLADGTLRILRDALAGPLGSVGWVARAVGISASAVITTPFNVTIAVLLYFDQGIRKEGTLG